jgi:DNA-binding beta-propeller fold protein YncE
MLPLLIACLLADVRVIPTPEPEPLQLHGTAPRSLLNWGSYGEGPGQFIHIADIAVDRGGDVYVLDANRSLIRKYSSQGQLLLEWGARGEQPGQLQGPVNLTVDDDGRVYVSDFSLNCIHRFTVEGQYLGRWGTRGSGPGELHGPQGVAADGQGSVYVVDRYNFRVQKFTRDGRLVAQWGRRGSGPGEFLEPVGIAVDRSGNVYVADYEIGGVQKFSSGGRFLASWRTKRQNPQDFTYAFSVAVDSRNRVYLCDNHRWQIEEYSSDGTLIRAWTSKERGVRGFSWPTSLAVNDRGDVYVVGRREGEAMGNTSIHKFGFGPTPAEELIERAFGSLDTVGAALDTLLALPVGGSWAAWTLGRFAACRERGGSHDVFVPSVPWAAECHEAMAAGTLETRAYRLGFEKQTSLDRAVARLRVRSSEHVEQKELLDAFADLLARRLGFPVKGAGTLVDRGRGPIDARVFQLPGGQLHLTGARVDELESMQEIRVERASFGLLTAESAPQDTADLRLLEGMPYDRESARGDLIRALSHRPRLASALWTNPGSIQDLAEIAASLESVKGPGSDPQEHDLVHLAADVWLASLQPFRGNDSQVPREMRESLKAFGVRFSEGFEGEIRYYGSLLPALASRVGENPWTNCAYVLLLDQGWETDGGGRYEGAEFANEVFQPVLKHGEEYLRTSRRSSLWSSVALRVALAHETAWSLGFATYYGDFPDYKTGAGAHRTRALELYRDLRQSIRDPRFAKAVDRKIQMLDRGRDTKCRVYYLEYED